MTTRIHAITALLLAGTALAATPALAANMVAGWEGPAEVPTDRAAPFSFGDITPMPTPQVEPGTERDFLALSPEDALAGMGTVTLSRDGTTTVTPPSEQLRAIFEEWMKSNMGG
jgi:hypothetical protein